MKYSLQCLFGFLEVFKKKSPQRPELPEDLCRQFSLAEIKAATNNFHRDSFIALGGLGAVHRGTMTDGTMVVVKRLVSGLSYGVAEFRQEVQLLSQLRHPHIISLLGFCDEQNEMIIVYEYMSRGSLDSSLFGNSDVPLGWKQRLQICIGVARGLHYIHTGPKQAVIHRDIKTSNILLDDEWSSKLSEFGLSIVGPRSMSKPLVRIPSRPAGTRGYVAPENFLDRGITDKCDVFSFGFVLLDVLCGKRFFDIISNGEFSREENIYDHVIDPYLKGRIAPDCFKKYLGIASSCVKENQNERPDMGEVEVTLELALELQEKADSEMEDLNPYAEWMYDEDVSFSLRDVFGD
ncbi:hypothetical protein PTKIN_Ptkin15bG0179900 [Pterospermum kingtungense]